MEIFSPGPQGGYLGGSQPMLPCVTLCPLISPKTVKIPALKGLKGFCHIKKLFSVCCSSQKVVQKTRLQYIEMLSQSKDIYILNLVFTFYVFSSTAILFICTRFLLLFSIVFAIINIINWM